MTNGMTNQTVPADKNKWRPYWKRFWIVLLISAVLSVAVNEFSFYMQRDEHDRGPTTLELVIPAGAAAQAEAGETAPGIPVEMVFVVGDTLQVVNQDEVAHQLGPIWVPAGTTGTLVMEQADRMSMTCSFQASKYMGIEVRLPTTWGTRLTGLFLAAPTTLVLFYLYSLLLWPLDRKPGKAAA